MSIQRIMIGGFLILAIAFAALIFKLKAQDKNDWIEKATQSKVVDIYQGYKGKPNYQIMKLASSQSFTIPKEMLDKLAIGDSVFKQKDSSFYIFIKANTTEKIRTGWQ